MILLHIPANGGKAEMVSLPRDSLGHDPGALPWRQAADATASARTGAAIIPPAQNKLNAAYSFGGANLAVSTVQANTHVPINHYIVINFLGFVNMVDKLGGVPICDSKPINDPVHRDPSTGGYVGSGLTVPAPASDVARDAGAGVRARARVRPAQGDLGRIQRQQKFMGGDAQQGRERRRAARTCRS